MPLKRPGGYVMSFVPAAYAPADATVYYLTAIPNLAPDAGADSFPFFIPIAGIIRSCFLRTIVLGTLGTAGQNAQLDLLINNTTANLVSAAVAHNAVIQDVSNVALSIPVARGDRFMPKITTPTWTTNPTNVIYIGQIGIETP